MTEDELRLANGWVARFHRSTSQDEKFCLQLDLLRLGVNLDHPVLPGPGTPDGGSTVALRKVS